MSIDDDIFELEQWLANNAPDEQQKAFERILAVLAAEERENMRLAPVRDIVIGIRTVWEQAKQAEKENTP